MFTKFLFVVCVWVVTVDSEFSPVNLPVRRYCSSALSEALKLTCGGHYTQMADTRDDHFPIFPEKFLRSRFIRELLPERVHECCKRPCGYNELKKYCPASD